jgi:hypothetical protein
MYLWCISDFPWLYSKDCFRVFKFGRRLPITSEIAIKIQLECENIPFIDEWAFLGYDGIIKYWDTVDIPVHAYWGGLGTSIRFQDFDLFLAGHQESIFPFKVASDGKKDYERLNNYDKSENICGYILPLIGLLRIGPAPANSAVTSLTQAVQCWMARQNGISTNHLTSVRRVSASNKSERISPGRGQTVIRADGHSFGNNSNLISKDGVPGSGYTKICDYFESRLH